MYSNQEDYQLIQGVINGDVNSQNKLYKKYKSYVKNYLKKNYTLNDDLDDNVSEILIKIFMNLNTCDFSKSSFTTWVCNIAKNHMIDRWRSNSTFNNRSHIFTSITLSDDSNNRVDYEFNTSNSISNFEINDMVNYITSGLLSCDCVLLQMRYLCGYNYCEIGNEFNLSSTTVSNRVGYIKNKLKNKLKNKQMCYYV